MSILPNIAKEDIPDSSDRPKKWVKQGLSLFVPQDIDHEFFYVIMNINFSYIHNRNEVKTFGISGDTMNFAVMRHEFKMMLRSRKNIYFIIAAATLILGFSLFVVPAMETPDGFNVEEVEQEIQHLDALREGMIKRGGTGIVRHTGMTPYATDTKQRHYLSRMIHAYQDNDINRFVNFRLKARDYTDFGQMLDVYTLNVMVDTAAPYPALDQQRFNALAHTRYTAYLDSGIPLTFEMLEQKTAVQTLVNFIHGTTSAFFIFCAIFFSCDILTRDRLHRSILQGLPIGWYRLINLKTLTALFYTFIVILFLILLMIVATTTRTGFGSFQLPVPITMPPDPTDDFFGYAYSTYGVITVGQFLLFALALGTILIYLFIRLNALLSLFLKNSWLVLMVGTAILFSEWLYFSRTMTELFGIDLSHFPQTYFDFGKIISGEKYYLLHLDTITYDKGILVLLVTVLIVEIALFVSARTVVGKRRFFQQAA